MDPAHSSTDVGSTDGHEKSFDGRSRRRFPFRAFASKLLGPPGKVILGQLILQIAAWGFFAAIWAKGIISVSYFGLPKPIWFKPLGWACTLLSTVLSCCSSYLFSWGVRQAITLHLQREGMSFDTFISSIKIASRSPIQDRNRRQLMMLSIAIVVLTGTQTSGWNSLLMPAVSTFDTDVNGRELDLSSPLLRPILASGALDYCVSNSSRLVALSVGQTGSGYAALNGDLGFPTSLTLMDSAFNTSTGGILPLDFRSINVSAWFPDTTVIPAALSAPSVGLDNGLSWTSSIIQQGFSADVHCAYQNLTSDTTPSLVVEITNGTDSSPSIARMASNCVVPDGSDPTSLLNITAAETFIGDGHGYILMIACGGSAESYKLILAGSGLYDYIDTMVCTLTPKITTVWVDYSYDLYSHHIAATTLDEGISDLGGPAGISAVTTIYNMLSFSQSLDTNVVGDQFTSVLDDLDGANFFLNRDILSVTEEYLRGVAEYSGTVFRACLSAENGTFDQGVPKNMSRLITGKLHTQFFGWEPTVSIFWILIPGTLVAGATIYIMLAAVACHAEDPTAKHEFDPADTVHLMSASAVGGLSDVFGGTALKDVTLAVGEFEGREPAFIMKRRNV